MAQVFLLQGDKLGKSMVLMNRYRFIDGAMVVEDDEQAKMMESNLVGFYLCKKIAFETYQEGVEKKRLEKATAELAAQQAALKAAAAAEAASTSKGAQTPSK